MASEYKELQESGVIIGGCFAVVAVLLSLFLIFQHLRSYNNPAEQIWIVAVLFMVPVYATESILSLWNQKLSFVCDILRNCYEAFALYAFGSYLVACLGGEMGVIQLLEHEKQQYISLNEPLVRGSEENRRSCFNFFCKPYIIGSYLFTIVKYGLVQYMILKTFCTFLSFLLELLGVYGDGNFKWYYGYPYIAAVLNFSQMWALYCLVQFYNVMHERLKPIKPLAKFISFKAIVFATWWQGVGIALLCAIGVLPKAGEFRNGLQDFLICIEMTVAAVAHVFVFSTEAYHFIPASDYERITAKTATTELKLGEGEKQKLALLEKKDIQVEAPGTSISESVQDIVVEGSQSVVKDVVLAINQTIRPVEKGMTKIQETFHWRSGSSEKGVSDLKLEEYVEENLTEKESEADLLKKT